MEIVTTVIYNDEDGNEEQRMWTALTLESAGENLGKIERFIQNNNIV